MEQKAISAPEVPIDDLLGRIEAEGGFDSIKIKKSDIESLSESIYGGGDEGSRESYADVKHHLGELLKTEEDMKYAIRARGSPLMKYFENAKEKVAKFVGVDYHGPSIDELIERQHDIADALQGSLKVAEGYAHQKLAQIVDYRDNVALKEFQNAAEMRWQAKQEGASKKKVYDETVARLENTKRSEPHYSKLLMATSNLKRQIQERICEATKANQTIVFRGTELKALEKHEDIVHNALLLFDQIAQHASNVAQHAGHIQQLYEFFRDGAEISEMCQGAYESLSRTAVLQEQEIAANINRMAEIAKNTGKNILMPDAFADQTRKYSGKALDITKGINIPLDKKADAFLEGYGKP
ncbi:hypothetical protein JXB11_04445 [Candidatus Woesearchaeota archaeon]|nr:hypothetical protein [Candidatus Woesearchaeota archaeon]